MATSIHRDKENQNEQKSINNNQEISRYIVINIAADIIFNIVYCIVIGHKEPHQPFEDWGYVLIGILMLSVAGSILDLILIMRGRDDRRILALKLIALPLHPIMFLMLTSLFKTLPYFKQLIP